MTVKAQALKGNQCSCQLTIFYYIGALSRERASHMVLINQSDAVPEGHPGLGKSSADSLRRVCLQTVCKSATVIADPVLTLATLRGSRLREIEFRLTP